MDTMIPDASRANQDLALLAEMVRECERIGLHQVRRIQTLERATEHLVALGAAAMTGGTVLGLLSVLQRPLLVDSVFGVVMVGSAGLNLLALIALMAAIGRSRRPAELHAGPRAERIVEKSSDADWTLVDHYLSVLRDYPSYGEWIKKRLGELGSLRSLGVYLLVAAVTGYASAFIYMMTKAIGG